MQCRRGETERLLDLKMSDERLRILLADDHAMVRGGLSLMIKMAQKDVEILESSDYQETLARLADDPSIDLLLMDLLMPGMQGLEGVAHICATYPEVPVAVISVKEDIQTIRRALDTGAVGYIPKTSSPSVTTSAIQLILAGGIYVPPHVLRQDGSAEEDAIAGSPPSSSLEPFEPSAESLGITPRQKDVLDLLASGKPNKEIATLLGLTPGTVKMHTSRIFKLLKVSNRTEAVAKYTQMKRNLENA